jgi:hypothetical protein
MIEGKKYDEGKLRWDLLMWREMQQVVKVLQYGANKYDDENWKYVDRARERYFSACLRHITTWWQGEQNDAETGLSHLAHAICDLLFLMWFDNEKEKKN